MDSRVGPGSAAQIAQRAQQRLADTQPGTVQAVLTTGLTAGSAATSLACSGGTSGTIPSGAIVSVLSGDQCDTFTTSVVAATGATTISVTVQRRRSRSR
jgi:hypothetical protein